MSDPTNLSRLQFAFTLTYHYLFPQLTMGLAFLLVLFKTLHLLRREESYNTAARFWARIFAITFVMGVVTGIPMELQFGTNWARFSAGTGAIIAQTLAMEGAFAFFLESAFLGVLLFGERAVGRTLHWLAAVLVWLGTWASGASSSPPMLGCSTQWATGCSRVASSSSPTTGRCSSTPGSCPSTCTP